jgi:FkbM family methyltransferase
MSVLKTFIKLLLGRGIGSQFGEDAFLLSRLPDKGTYVDIGCYHPHLYSNTYKLYRRGWKGVSVDPNPDMALLWRIFRPRDRFINAAVGSGGDITYYRYRDGAYNGFRQLDRPIKDQVHIQTIPLAGLIPPQGIDFLNIDAEGMDMEILESHDWKTKPTVIAVEGRTSDELLKQKGYRHLITLGETSIYSI